MKKFYSFVAIVAVALASMCVCVSCEKDEPGNETQNKELLKDFTMVLSEDIYNMCEITVIVEQDGKTTEHKSSEASAIDSIVHYVGLTKKTFIGKALSVKGLKNDAVVKCISVANEKAMETMPERIYSTFGYKITYTSGIKKYTSQDIFNINGTLKEKVPEFITKEMETITKYTFTKNPFEEKK